MRFFLVLCLIAISQSSKAQFGIRILYDFNQSNEWREALNDITGSQETDLFDKSYTVSLDYWFRLKNVRLEIFPDVSYTRYNSNSTFQGLESQYKMDVYGLGLTAQLYLLDFFGDCDCPTFSKQGNFLKKGFFVFARPGIQQYAQKLSINNNESSSSIFGGSLAGGIGLDIGITDLITLSPTVSFKMNPSINWEGFFSAHGITDTATIDEKASINQWQFGLRIGFRPDYRK